MNPGGIVSTDILLRSRVRTDLSLFHLLVLLFASLVMPPHALPLKTQPSADAGQGRLTLVEAVVCEEIKDQGPRNQAVLFTVNRGKVICFTAFDPVPRETFIYHRWFHRDRQVTNIRLSLKPSRWSTLSRIDLREIDKGPWRVEIVDRNSRVLKVLRFSIAD